MNLDSCNEALGQIHNMLLAQQVTMNNRTLINRLFDGDPSDSEEQRRAENRKTNVNWLEAQRLASNSTNQINNAFFKPPRFFTVKLDKGPIRMRNAWSEEISKYINQELKRSRSYKSARESANAQVVLHGPGPVVWRNTRCPIPETAGIEDIIVPSGTLASMDNLDRFGIYRELSWSQLESATSGSNTDPGWNKPYLTALLQTLFNTGVVPIYQGNRWLFPEKLQEDVKEGAAAMASSSLPKLLAWDFFYRDENSGKWNRRMVVDYANISTSGLNEKSDVVKKPDFLYSRDNYAGDWSEIIHWYMGNCSNVSPYRYYAIRSIGYLLYGPCLIANKIRNRFADHIFQQLLTLFYNVSDDNREKLGLIDLQNFGVIPDGVSMVTANERHNIDPNLILTGLNQMRQLMAESASSFVPDTQGENGKQMTATETLVRQNTSVSLTSAVLNQLGDQSKYEYREICRRFCIKGNPDPMAKRFRENIQKAGVPIDMLDVEAWEIIPEQTVGGGNKSVELNITSAMMQELLPAAGPEGQRIILHRRYMALTDNPEEAELVFPDAPQPPSDDVQYAQFAFSVLILGMPFAVREGVNEVAYTAMLLQMMKVGVQQVQALLGQPAGLGIAADRVAGLMNVGQHAEQQIQLIGRDKTKIPVAKQLFQALTQLMGALQNFGKQIMADEQDQARQQGGVSPETQAKIQERLLLAQTNSKIMQDKAAQKQQEKDVAFHNENMRRNASVGADIQRKFAQTKADIASTDLTTHADIIRQSNELQGAETQ